jgi:hypothetical protein
VACGTSPRLSGQIWWRVLGRSFAGSCAWCPGIQVPCYSIWQGRSDHHSSAVVPPRTGEREGQIRNSEMKSLNHGIHWGTGRSGYSNVVHRLLLSIRITFHYYACQQLNYQQIHAFAVIREDSRGGGGGGGGHCPALQLNMLQSLYSSAFDPRVHVLYMQRNNRQDYTTLSQKCKGCFGSLKIEFDPPTS